MHRLRGYVVKRYTCLPCQTKAKCKPCVGDNIVLSDDPTLHAVYQLDDRDVIVFTKGADEFPTRRAGHCASPCAGAPKQQQGRG